MARTGVFLADVKKARDQLVAQGRRPSIDAIRAALGDTGSKSTIHKHLRELEAAENGPPRTASAAILDLASQLADQLDREANSAVDAVRNEMAALRAAHDADMAARQHALHVSQQALAQFRSVAKEQRDQESRRHVQQLQAVQAELREAHQATAMKQEELIKLNKQTAALAAELAAGKQSAFLDRENNRHLARQITRLQAAESRVTVLEAQLAETRTQIDTYEAAAAHTAAVHYAFQQEQAKLVSELAQATAMNVLEARLAKLDQAVFGGADAEPG